MKHLKIVILVIVLIVFVICSGLYIYNKRVNIPTNTSYSTNNTKVTNDNEPIQTEEQEDEPKVNALEDVNKYKETIALVIGEPLLIGENTYNDINTVITTQHFANPYKNSQMKTDGDNSYNKISDSYMIHSNIRKGILFDTDKELLPSKLYLVDDTVNAFYSYNGNVYYIPVEKCSNEDEERIVYREYNLIIMKKTGNVAAFSQNIDISLPEVNDQSIMFNMLYSTNPEGPFSNYKAYETDLDNDSTTKEIYFNVLDFDKNLGPYIHSKLLRKDNQNLISVFDIPYTIAGNIDSFKDVFYSSSNPRGNSYNDYTKDYLPISYILFDTKEGFKEIFKFANGDDVVLNEENPKFVKYSLTLSKDITCYVLTDEQDTINYTTSIMNAETIIIPAGTKFKLVKITDYNGNSVVRLEDGKLLEFAK